MTKEQAQKEYLNLLRQQNDDKEEIIKKAKANGTWKAGLDSNNDLFTELDNDFKKKVELLKSMID